MRQHKRSRDVRAGAHVGTRTASTTSGRSRKREPLSAAQPVQYAAPAAAPARRSAGDDAPGPLDGVKVLDMTTVIAGPLTGGFLAGCALIVFAIGLTADMSNRHRVMQEQTLYTQPHPIFFQLWYPI